MIEFPETVLPLPQRDYAVEHDPRLLVQRFEVGTRQRKRFTGGLEVAAITWQCNYAQWKFLKTFIFNILFQGAEKFEMTIPTVEGLKRHEVLIVQGTYSEQHFTGGVDVSVNIEILNPLNLSDLEYWVIFFFEGSESYLEDFIAMDEALFNSLVHYSTP